MTAPEGVAARLGELEALHAAATPGPWQVDDDGDECAVTAGTARGLPGSWRATDRIYTVDVGEWSGETEDEASQRSADAALIVAAVNALPDLIAAVRAVAELVDEWRASIHILDEIDRFEVVRGIDAALSALSGRDDHTERQSVDADQPHVARCEPTVAADELPHAQGPRRAARALGLRHDVEHSVTGEPVSGPTPSRIGTEGHTDTPGHLSGAPGAICGDYGATRPALPPATLDVQTEESA